MPSIYSDEFKRDAVALVESGIAQHQVVRDLGISKTALSNWVRDARFQAHGMTPSKPGFTDGRAGNEPLR